MIEAVISTGKPYPLGSTFDGEGVNFAIFSKNAEKIELCLFNKSGSKELIRYEITERTNSVWHIYLKGIKAEQVYGYRVYGPYKPEEGHRFNHNKLLLDPYGKKLVGKLIWNKAIFGYDVDSPEKDLSFSKLDSAPYVPKSVVISGDYDWEDDKHLETSFEETIIYETHVRSFTKLHPRVPDYQRGKFSAFTYPSVISYLKWLGITAVEFLPIHAFMGNRVRKGFLADNYWGYESFSFFAPEQSFLSRGNINELKDTIKTLHKNGLEVILDVVYNHTGEGNQLGPTICWRGIDNSIYYTLNPTNKRYYFDSTGCGSSFNVQHPQVMKLVLDSLRYWVKDMHIDGFRFDLATSLSRVDYTFTQKSGFMEAVRQDPVLEKVKLIAEPWDVDMGGYQLGAFLPGWCEWNDQYRDVVRSFWKGDEGKVPVLASRLSGSSDIFNYRNRNIWTSINFITAHDGFSLNDLVSYNTKHNISNGEENRDGTNNNISWNSGAEGETDNSKILNNRLLRARAMITTLLLSFGTPMILAGDEMLKPQFGNNNPYCQDNIINWFGWEGFLPESIEFARYVRKLILLRKRLSIFKRGRFFKGQEVEHGLKDLTWYTSLGIEFADADWNNNTNKAIAYSVYDGEKHLLVIMNANYTDIDWTLPDYGDAEFELLIDSSMNFKSETDAQSKNIIKAPAWGVLAFEIKDRS